MSFLRNEASPRSKSFAPHHNAARYRVPNSTHVRDIGLAESKDEVVWLYAKQFGYTIVSKDADFQQRAVLLGFPPKVIWLRIGNCSTKDVVDLILSYNQDIKSFLLDPVSSFMALS